MNRTTFVLGIAVGLSAATAWAFPPSDPWLPTEADIQSQIEKDFDGGAQASMGTRTNIPGGVHVDAAWSTGEAFVNTDFTRLVYTNQFPDDNGDGDGGDFESNDGAAWKFTVESGAGITVKPYTQIWDTFTFYEGTQPSTPAGGGEGTFFIGAGESAIVEIDWDTVNNGGMISEAERGDIFEIGWQIFGPGLAQDGSTAQTSFTITSVPEPGTLALVGLGGLALLAGARRRRV